MTYPYSSGDVVTAADMNSGGLHLITPSSVTGGTLSGATVNIGTAVSSVTVNGVFSGNFDNYRIMINNIYGSQSNQGLQFTWPGVTTGWFGNRTSMIDSSATLSVGQHQNNVPIIGVTQTSNQGMVTMDVMSPALATRSGVMGSYYGNYNGTFSYQHNIPIAYTDFAINPQAGTFTGGTIRVYGYSNG